MENIITIRVQGFYVDITDRRTNEKFTVLDVIDVKDDKNKLREEIQTKYERSGYDASNIRFSALIRMEIDLLQQYAKAKENDAIGYNGVMRIT